MNVGLLVNTYPFISQTPGFNLSCYWYSNMGLLGTLLFSFCKTTRVTHKIPWR